MANVGKVTIEVRPTVTLESAAACVMMLNLFFADNDGYRLARRDGEWYLTDEPPKRGARGGDMYSCVLSSIPNPGSPSNMTEDERRSIAKAMEQSLKETTRKDV